MRPLTATTLALGAIALAPAAALAAPPGFVRVQTSFLPAPAGIQSGGQIACPAGTVPFGGGAGFAGGLPDFGMNLNTSAPSGNGWRARYNNSSARNASFVIMAMCAKAPKRYTTTFATIDNPPGDEASTTATCPARTVVLGGGAFSTSDVPGAAITSAWPSSTKTYTGFLFNGTTRAERLTVFAVCGKKPLGYQIVSSTGSGTGPADFVGGVQCPRAKVLLSGGIRVTDPRPAVTFGASFQDSGEQWVGEVLGNTTGVVEDTLYAVCAA
jgi:hypothetical protein